jgi:putative molybdopterin biosynthesis protein
VLAEPVFRPSPPNYHAAMDGVAVKAETAYGSSDPAAGLSVGRRAFFISTGNVLPAGTDAVIMIENVR